MYITVWQKDYQCHLLPFNLSSVIYLFTKVGQKILDPVIHI